jgi:hypothetical protein
VSQECCKCVTVVVPVVGQREMLDLAQAERHIGAIVGLAMVLQWCYSDVTVALR